MIKFHRPFDPHKIRLLIFDLDGTLIDSRLDLVHSVNATLRHMKRPELPDDVIASYVGDGAPALIGRALGKEAGDERRDEAAAVKAARARGKLDEARHIARLERAQAFAGRRCELRNLKAAALMLMQ